MAIEIREIVIKATVNKNSAAAKGDFVTKSDLEKAQDKFARRLLNRVRDLLEEQRAFR
jgi:hypothetical protein